MSDYVDVLLGKDAAGCFIGDGDTLNNFFLLRGGNKSSRLWAVRSSARQKFVHQ